MGEGGIVIVVVVVFYAKYDCKALGAAIYMFFSWEMSYKRMIYYYYCYYSQETSKLCNDNRKHDRSRAGLLCIQSKSKISMLALLQQCSSFNLLVEHFTLSEMVTTKKQKFIFFPIGPKSSRVLYHWGGETRLSVTGGQISTCHSAAIIMCGLAGLLIHTPRPADNPSRAYRRHFSSRHMDEKDGKKGIAALKVTGRLSW